MDNGSELISVQLADWIELNSVKLEFIKLGTPTKNSLDDLTLWEYLVKSQ